MINNRTTTLNKSLNFISKTTFKVSFGPAQSSDVNLQTFFDSKKLKYILLLQKTKFVLPESWNQ